MLRHIRTLCYQGQRRLTGMLTTALLGSAMVSTSALAADLPFRTSWQTVADGNQPHLRWGKQLQNGKVLLINLDVNANYNRTKIYLYNPANNSLDLQATPGIFSGARGAIATELNDGHVLVVTASTTTTGSGKSALFNPNNGRWTTLGNLTTMDRRSSTIWADPDGGARVQTNHLSRHLVVGHERLNRGSGQWSDNNQDPGYFNAMLPLPDGNVIGKASGDLAVLDTSALTVRVVSSNPQATNTRTPTYVRSGAKVIGIISNDLTDAYEPSTISLGSGAITVMNSISRDAARIPVTGCSIDANGTPYAGYLTNQSNAAAQVHIYDHRDASIKTLPNFPVSNRSNIVYSIQLTDGLLVAATGNDNKLKLRRLKVTPTGGGSRPPAMIANDLPSTIRLTEGSLTSFHWHLEGTIPNGGVDVIVERLNGDGDVQVVTGARAHADFDFQSFQVSVAALIDADGNDDTATIRLRIDQGNGRIDPNARTVNVEVTDTVTGDNTLLPGDANNDGVVNADDLQSVIDNFGRSNGGN